LKLKVAAKFVNLKVKVA